MHQTVLRLLLLFCCVYASAASAAAAREPQFTFSSGQHQVNVLELYTSEGCSSCPPAEAWFGQLLDSPDLWRRIVPMAFHVDYWNDLGWMDPFSTADNSQRQRRYQTEGGVDAVYTPGFVLNGKEWRGWFSGEPLPDKLVPAGQLDVEVADSQLQASYRNEQATLEPLELHVALLGFNLTTQVAAGENRGEVLTHQFVVLKQAAALSANNNWTLTVPHSAVTAQRLALAVWITRPNRQQPLQASGGWLP